MATQYEYKFVRLGEGWFGTKSEAKSQYQSVIHQHARAGWRLVQVFATSIGVYGASTFYEVILEREIQ